MMKRISALLLSALLLFSLAGAGLPIVGDETEPSDPIFNGEDLFALGSINGDTYENPFIGYGCKLEGWNYADAQMIASMNNIASDILSEDMQDMYRNASVFTEMYASSPDNLQNINIQYQNIAQAYGSALDSIDLSTFMEMLAPSLPTQLEQSGFTDVQAVATSVPLGTEQHPGITITSKISGIDCYQKEACIRTDDYLVFLCVSSFVTDTTDELLSLFYPLVQNYYVSPADNLNFAVRLASDAWQPAESDGHVEFNNTASTSGLSAVMMLSEDMSYLDESLQSFAILDIMLSSVKEEATASAEANSNFVDIADCTVGGQYEGRILTGTFTRPDADAELHASLISWFAESRIYLVVSICTEENLADTTVFTQTLLDSFQTATDYYAQSVDALDPAA